MSRGMTMLEVLVALSLLAALSVAAAGWIQVAARACGPTQGRLRWQGAADAVLQLIADDLATGDFQTGLATRDRVTAFERRLTVWTREHGHAERHTYSYSPSGGTLALAGADGDRPLLTRVSAWSCALDTRAGVLDVVIAGPDAQRVTRRFRIP